MQNWLSSIPLLYYPWPIRERKSLYRQTALDEIKWACDHKLARSVSDGALLRTTHGPVQNGKNRLAVQTARLHLPIERNLRRHRRLLGLRSAGRRAEEEHQGRLVAGHGAQP